ncbi:hypothetical protein ACGFNU_21620 [Spirillospora sp. NPDC048911]|uniref:hypothetical protein n=1 Tax=Spirillospora sp. NPDC048911 TaxID=3364527 RepID=UPI003722B57B
MGERTPERYPPARARFWRLEMPAGQTLLNANRQLHWSQKARIVRQLRSDAYFIAKYVKVPPLKRARIDAYYCPPPARRTRDAANWQPTFKAQVDGIVDAGVLPDDDHTHLEGPFPHIGDPHPDGRVVLIITELEPTPGVSS